jgi:hypothetical protein
MSPEKRYYFSDFTRENYKRLVKLAKENYKFCLYPNIEENNRFILWRHDVDFSINAARKLAVIETEENVVATYFLHLHSEFYNVLEKETANHIRSIISYGHSLGVHFDPSFYGTEDISELESKLVLEQRILEDIFECPINAFSFHNPTPSILCLKNWQYGGMINTYADYFQEQVGYCSDSNGYWRHTRLEDILKDAKHERLQILTHPAWWTKNPMSPAERVKKCIYGRVKYCELKYDEQLKNTGRYNITNDQP